MATLPGDEGVPPQHGHAGGCCSDWRDEGGEVKGSGCICDYFVGSSEWM